MAKKKSGKPAAKSRRGISGGKPRARSFRYAESSKPLSRVPRDDRTLKRSGPQVEIVRPAWNGSTGTTFRPLPMFCAEDPESLDPTRLSTDDYDFGDWTRGLPAAKYVGIDQKFTFLLYDPRRVHDEGYNPREENPYNILYNAVMDAAKEGEAIVDGKDVITGKWGALTVDGPKKAFNSPTKLHFYQGLIYEHNGETYVKEGLPKGARDGDLPQIIEVSKTGGNSLSQLLNRVDPEYNGDTSVESQGEMYLYGDLVDPIDGKFVTFYNPDKHDVAGAPDQDEDDRGRQFKGWESVINDTFDYVHRRQTSQVQPSIESMMDKALDQIVWWDDLLYIPPEEEICLWLATAFKSMPDLLRFGWGDHPEFFTDEVQGVLANRSQGTGVDIPTDDEDDIPAAKPPKVVEKSSAIPDVEEDEDDEEDEDEDNLQEAGTTITSDFDDDEYEEDEDEDDDKDKDDDEEDDEEDYDEDDEDDDDDDDDVEVEESKEEVEADAEAVAEDRSAKRKQKRVAPKKKQKRTAPTKKSPRKSK